VANIGEQLRDYDTKVFEVLISVNEQDSILRPAMTTGIEIQISDYENVNYIPLESLFKDSVNYVFVKNGNEIQKKEVVTGPANDLEIMILGGINDGDEVLLSNPSTSQDMNIVYFDSEEKKKLLNQQEQDEEKRKKELEEKRKNVVNDIENKEEDSPTIIFF